MLYNLGKLIKPNLKYTHYFTCAAALICSFFLCSLLILSLHTDHAKKVVEHEINYQTSVNVCKVRCELQGETKTVPDAYMLCIKKCALNASLINDEKHRQDILELVRQLTEKTSAPE